MNKTKSAIIPYKMFIIDLTKKIVCNLLLFYMVEVLMTLTYYFISLIDIYTYPLFVE